MGKYFRVAVPLGRNVVQLTCGELSER